jgi:hypothetical protein
MSPVLAPSARPQEITLIRQEISVRKLIVSGLEEYYSKME